MIDSEVVDSFETVEDRHMVKQALAVLATLNVFLKQDQLERERLLTGDNTEPIESMAISIRAYRTKSQQLLTLHQIGEAYAKELTS